MSSTRLYQYLKHLLQGPSASGSVPIYACYYYYFFIKKILSFPLKPGMSFIQSDNFLV